MMLRSLALAVFALLITASLAKGQGLDLPVGPNDYARAKANLGKSPPPVPDKPQDDKAPVFYGQKIATTSDSVFFVIDISGSMGWDEQQYIGRDGTAKTGNRLDRAKVALIKAVNSLPGNFVFDMLAYDCGVYEWSVAMKPADDTDKASAAAWINALQPQGGTGTGPAVGYALAADRNNKLVVLLSDGDPNCPFLERQIPQTRDMISRLNSQHAVIDTFGISAEGSFRTFLMDVASDSGGSYTDVK